MDSNNYANDLAFKEGVKAGAISAVLVAAVLFGVALFAYDLGKNGRNRVQEPAEAAEANEEAGR
jgi:hypothetical protein